MEIPLRCLKESPSWSLVGSVGRRARLWAKATFKILLKLLCGAAAGTLVLETNLVEIRFSSIGHFNFLLRCLNIPILRSIKLRFISSCWSGTVCLMSARQSHTLNKPENLSLQALCFFSYIPSVIRSIHSFSPFIVTAYLQHLFTQHVGVGKRKTLWLLLPWIKISALPRIAYIQDPTVPLNWSSWVCTNI